MRKRFIILVLAGCLVFGLAEAHPFIVNTDPVQSSNISTGINQIVIHYSEAVEKDYSSIKVFDNNGNQVDNKDTKYFQGEDSLVVTTQPLGDGVYTVTSKVLSKIDGHLVDDAFVFAVGNARIPINLPSKSAQPSVYIPEAVARFPGLVGQVMVLGATISSLLIWNSIKRKNTIKESGEKLQTRHSHAFLKLTGIGLFLVFVSNIAMLAVQSIVLQTSALNAIQTGFGTTWLTRMILTVVLFIIWFWAEKKTVVGKVQQLLILGFALALISTTTMLGHPAASMHKPAMILDYTHNLLASIWIGGVIYTAFVMIPSFGTLESGKKERLSFFIIPKVSSMVIIAVGILIITGPTLLWFLESNVGLLYNSTYGKLILAKIALGSVMVAIGGYNQFRIQKPAEKDIESGSVHVYNKFRKSLKIESAVGIILLGVVALLANTSLPEVEIQQVQAQEVSVGYNTIQFSSQAKFDISITPFSSGANTITAFVETVDGTPLTDISGLKMKVSNPQRNIAPINLDVLAVESSDRKSVV